MRKKIRIGAVDYRIERVNDLRDGDRGLNGWIKHNECLIQVEEDLNSQEAWAVLWHEALHGILNQAGIVDHSEQELVALAYGIVGVLKANRWMAEVIDGGED